MHPLQRARKDVPGPIRRSADRATANKVTVSSGPQCLTTAFELGQSRQLHPPRAIRPEPTSIAKSVSWPPTSLVKFLPRYIARRYRIGLRGDLYNAVEPSESAAGTKQPEGRRATVASWGPSTNNGACSGARPRPAVMANGHTP